MAGSFDLDSAAGTTVHNCTDGCPQHLYDRASNWWKTWRPCPSWSLYTLQWGL